MPGSGAGGAYDTANYPADLAAVVAQLGLAKWAFSLMPDVHYLGNEGIPINARYYGDGYTVGNWNLNHDGTDGDILHFTTGVNTAPSRAVTDGATTSGSAIITSATGAFVNADGSNGNGGDIAKVVTGAGIQAGSKILSVQSATQVTLDKVATATATGVSLTIGAGNANGAVIAIGVDNGGNGIVVRNKYKGNGLNVQQTNTVAVSTSYAMTVDNASAVAPAVRFQQRAAADLFQLYASSAPAGSNHLAVYDNAGYAGVIKADTGVVAWERNIQVKASGAGSSPIIRVLDEAANPSEVYLGAKTTGFTGLKSYQWSGSAALMFTSDIQMTADRIKFRTATGAANKGGETMQTIMEFQIGTRAIGFFGVSPVARPTLAAAATDAATTQTLANSLRSQLIALGLCQ